MVYTRAPADKKIRPRTLSDSSNAEHSLRLEMNPFSRMRSMDFLASIKASVNCIARLDRDLMALGFEDGTIRVFLCDLLSADLVQRNARMVMCIQGHRLDPSNHIHSCSIVSLLKCPWPTIRGGGYCCELLTAGTDNFINHWGLRPHLESENQIAVEEEGNVNATAAAGKEEFASFANAAAPQSTILRQDDRALLKIRAPWIADLLGVRLCT